MQRIGSEQLTYAVKGAGGDTKIFRQRVQELGPDAREIRKQRLRRSRAGLHFPERC